MTYSELKASIQRWLDNNNPNLIAEIPNLIVNAEAGFNRLLRTLEMECRASTPLVPPGATETTVGIYDLPVTWHEHKTVEVRDDMLVMLYYRKIPSLSDSEPSNWLLEAHQDLYLFASLAQAEAWLKNDPRVALWSTQASNILEQIRTDNEARQYSGGPIHASLAPRKQCKSGCYNYVPPYDFFDMEAAQGDWSIPAAGVFTTTEERKLRILPKPSLP